MPAIDVYRVMREHPRLRHLDHHDYGGRWLSKPVSSPHAIWVPLQPDAYGPPVLGDVRVGGEVLEGIHVRNERIAVHLYTERRPGSDDGDDRSSSEDEGADALNELIIDFIATLREVCVAVGNYNLLGGQPIDYKQLGGEGQRWGYRLNVQIGSPVYERYPAARPLYASVQIVTATPVPPEPDEDRERRERYERLCRWRRGPLGD